MKLLDHGSLDLVEAWGSDERIIESARMSTDKGFKGWGTPEVPGDEKLLRYLWKNGHHTPFEMAGATFEVQAPIFVFRQWHRHRTQSYNELSARYTELPDLFYIPSRERILAGKQSTTNKQGSEAGFSEAETDRIKDYFHDAALDTHNAYTDLLHRGVSKELARAVLPVSVYSKMRASANLRNWLHFVSLRTDPHAQYEIRVYAEAIESCLREKFPHAMEVYREKDYKLIDCGELGVGVKWNPLEKE